MHCSVERISFGIRITASPASRFSSRYTPPNPPPPTAFFGGKIVAVCPSFRRVPRVRGAGRPRPGRTCGKRLSWWPVIYLSLSSAWDTVKLTCQEVCFISWSLIQVTVTLACDLGLRRGGGFFKSRSARCGGAAAASCRWLRFHLSSNVLRTDIEGWGGVKVSEMSRMIWRIEDVANLRGRDRSLVEPEEVLLLGHF